MQDLIILKGTIVFVASVALLSAYTPQGIGTEPVSLQSGLSVKVALRRKVGSNNADSVRNAVCVESGVNVPNVHPPHEHAREQARPGLLREHSKFVL